MACVQSSHRAFNARALRGCWSLFPPLSRFINFRQKNVLDKLNYTFIRKLVTGNQPKGQEKISGAASLQLAIR